MRRMVLSLAIVSLAFASPASADDKLTSFAESTDAIFRTFLDGGQTTLWMWTKPVGLLDGSYSVFGPFGGLQSYREFTVGRVYRWGSPSILFSETYYGSPEAEDPHEKGWFNYIPGMANTGIYGCDVPDAAYVPDPVYPYASGFYQICPEEGYDGWVALEFVVEGKWTLNDFYVEGSGFNDPGPITVISPVPEPSTLLLLATGLLGVIGVARRRERKDRM